eukprot:Sspe_Gene.79328::Locus_49732_Transcript_1_1_Confidence_1.000_Length_2821::g.79328::m.79328
MEHQQRVESPEMNGAAASTGKSSSSSGMTTSTNPGKEGETMRRPSLPNITIPLSRSPPNSPRHTTGSSDSDGFPSPAMSPRKTSSDIASGSLNIGMAASCLALHPSTPHTPTPFLGRMSKNQSGLLSWWTRLRLQIKKGSASDKALSQLGKNFDLAGKERFIATVTSVLAILAAMVTTANFTLKMQVLDIFLTLLTITHIGCAFKMRVTEYQRDALLKSNYKDLYNHFVLSPQMARLLLQVLFISIHVPPGLSSVAGDRIRMLNCFVLLRLWEVRHTLTHYAFLSSAGGALVAGLAGQRVGNLFVFKAYLFKHPVTTMFLVTLLGFLVLSTAIWFVEGTEEGWTFSRSMWFTIVTFTTVGYGDTVPGSTIGKCVGVISAVFGITASAVLVSVVQHKLALSRIQKQMIMFLGEVRNAHLIKEVAAEIVAQTLIYGNTLRRLDHVPNHRSISCRLHPSSTARQLHRHWVTLLSRVQRLRRLRSGEESIAVWADISVLDVLQADPSDILAQNTIFQYMMKPADDSLSNQLRSHRRISFARTRRPRDKEARPSLSLVSPRGRSGLTSSDNQDTNDTNDIVEQNATRRDLGRTSSISSVSSSGTDCSVRTGRTARSTRALVDTFKNMVMSAVPPPASPVTTTHKGWFGGRPDENSPPRRAQRSRSEASLFGPSGSRFTDRRASLPGHFPRRNTDGGQEEGNPLSPENSEHPSAMQGSAEKYMVNDTSERQESGSRDDWFMETHEAYFTRVAEEAEDECIAGGLDGASPTGRGTSAVRSASLVGARGRAAGDRWKAVRGEAPTRPRQSSTNETKHLIQAIQEMRQTQQALLQRQEEHQRLLHKILVAVSGPSSPFQATSRRGSAGSAVGTMQAAREGTSPQPPLHSPHPQLDLDCLNSAAWTLSPPPKTLPKHQQQQHQHQ